MEFTNEFHVPTDIETTFDTLMDLEKVAPCLPGATLEGVDGNTYTGTVKVKVGPMQVAYHGSARLEDVDPVAKTGRIDAKGRATRGGGTASAQVTANLSPADEGTRVVVVTRLDITGKPAQFGRGVLEDVGTRIVDQFAERLRELLAPVPAASGAVVVSGTDGQSRGGAGLRASEERNPSTNEPLNLLELAGPTVGRRVAAPLCILALALAIVWCARGRGRVRERADNSV